jgi:beta-hydroxylase
MHPYVRELLSAKFLVLYAYAACVCYVHFRGKVRLRFARQFSEHSGLFAPFNILMYAFSAVPRDPVLDVAKFHETRVLKENWQVIRDEAVALLDQGRIDYPENVMDLTFVAFRRRGWKRFHMKWYGEFLPSALEACPRTVELLKQVPGLNAAAFTMLPPGKKLGKHRDPFASSLRYHLGLVTPNDDRCRIWIDGHEYSWRDGQDIVFDETYIHWAENATDQQRIILFCDITRPLHTRAMRAFSSFMNRRVFRITASRNEVDEQAGLLNFGTPIVATLKNFFLRAKSFNRPLYYTLKFALVGALFYFVFVDGFIDAHEAAAAAP